MSSLATFTKASVEQFAHEFENLFYQDDGAGMAAYYTDNARLFADGIAPIQGIAAVRAFWQATCERGKAMGMQRSITVNEVVLTTDVCYAYSTLTLDVTVGGQAVHRTVSDITIWRKQEDDSWKIEVDISVPNPED